MSTTEKRRPLAAALKDAKEFCALFPRECFSVWWPAGSVRRAMRHVGDIEHVVIPRMGDLPSNDLFNTPRPVNLLWRRFDELLEGKEFIPHIYGHNKAGAPMHRLGPKHRGVDWRGFCHEIFTADETNLGSVLAIRTGPGTYSRMLVTALQRNGYLNDEGYVWNKRDCSCACGWKGSELEHVTLSDNPEQFEERTPLFADGHGDALLCPRCRFGDQLTLGKMNVPDEETYFALCGVKYLRPEARPELTPRSIP